MQKAYIHSVDTTCFHLFIYFLIHCITILNSVDMFVWCYITWYYMMSTGEKLRHFLPQPGIRKILHGLKEPTMVKSKFVPGPLIMFCPTSVPERLVVKLWNTTMPQHFLNYLLKATGFSQTFTLPPSTSSITSLESLKGVRWTFCSHRTDTREQSGISSVVSGTAPKTDSQQIHDSVSCKWWVLS